MRGLLIKDFSFLAEQKRFFAIIFFVTVFLSLKSSDNFAVTYLTFLGGFLVISTIANDSNANNISYLMTLPVSRKIYVREKYVFAFLNVTIGELAGVLITGVVSFLQGRAVGPDQLAFQLVWILVCVVFLSLILPPTLKYGVEKGRIVLFIMFAVVLGGIYLIAEIAEQTGIDMDAVLMGLSSLETASLVAGIGVAALVAALVSYTVSVRIMQKKEF